VAGRPTPRHADLPPAPLHLAARVRPEALPRNAVRLPQRPRLKVPCRHRRRTPSGGAHRPAPTRRAGPSLQNVRTLLTSPHVSAEHAPGTATAAAKSATFVMSPATEDLSAPARPFNADTAVTPAGRFIRLAEESRCPCPPALRPMASRTREAASRSTAVARQTPPESSATPAKAHHTMRSTPVVHRRGTFRTVSSVPRTLIRHGSGRPHRRAAAFYAQ